jgi:hypothetical protein
MFCFHPNLGHIFDQIVTFLHERVVFGDVQLGPVSSFISLGINLGGRRQQAKDMRVS